MGGTALGASALLEPYRPILLLVTVALLGLAFWQSYRRPKKTAVVGSSAELEQETCCSTDANGSGASVRRVDRLLLWPIAVATLAFLLFPYYAGALAGPHRTGIESLDGASLLWTPSRDSADAADQAERLATELGKLSFISGTEPLPEGNRVRVDLVAGASPIDKADLLGFLSRNDIEGSLSPLHEQRFIADGMTCAACAVKLAHAMWNESSFGGVSVDHESGVVIILMTDIGEGSAQAIKAAAASGYSMRQEEGIADMRSSLEGAGCCGDLGP